MALIMLPQHLYMADFDSERIMYKLVNLLLTNLIKLFKKDIARQTLDSLTQFILFGIVGVSNTLISYLLNILVIALLRPYSLAWDYVAGNLAAFLLSVLWSFYWNNRIVFKQKTGSERNLWKTLLKAYIAYGFTGIILNNFCSWMWIRVFHISKYIAPLINLIISVPLNFVINKLWTFQEDWRSK